MARKTVLRHKDIVISGSLAALDIAAVVLIQVMMILPATSQAKLRGKKVEEAVKELESNARKERQFRETAHQNEQTKAKLAVFDNRIPVRSEIAAVFAEVLRSADTNKLKIVQTRPRAPAAIGQGFLRFPYELDLRGDYHAMGRFLTGVESDSSFMQVARATLSGDPEGTARMRVLLYLYGSAGGDSGTAGASAAGARFKDR